MKARLKYAFTKSLPVMAGYIFLGIAFGILLEEAGYNYIWAFFMSVFIYAGSMQFALVPLMVGMASPVLVAVTTFFVNSRHLFYGLSFIEAFNKIKQKPYMIFSLTDETYSVLCGCRNEDPDEVHRDTWFYISIFNHCYWIAGSVLGAILGQALPIDFTGIDFSMTALFIVILIEQVLANKKTNGIIALIGLGVTTIFLLLLGIDRFLLPALMATVAITSIYTIFNKNETETIAND